MCCDIIILGGFFDTFKVLLPNLIIAFGIVLSLIIALVLLPQNDRYQLNFCLTNFLQNIF